MAATMGTFQIRRLFPAGIAAGIAMLLLAVLLRAALSLPALELREAVGHELLFPDSLAAASYWMPLTFGFLFAGGYLAVRRLGPALPGFCGMAAGAAYGGGVFLVGWLPVCLWVAAVLPVSAAVTAAWVSVLFVQTIAAGVLVGTTVDGVTVRVATQLPISAGRAWELLVRKETFLHVTRGMLAIAEPEGLPEPFFVEGATVDLRVRPLSLPPWTAHRVTFERVDASAREIQTRESGGVVTTWNHLMRVERLTPQTCRYSDTVSVFAGWLSLGVGAFVWLFYRYRQRRWRALARADALDGRSV